MKSKLYSIDISKCETISKTSLILEILNKSRANNSYAKIKEYTRIKSKEKTKNHPELLRIKEIKTHLMLEKLKSKLDMPLKTGDEIEVFIDEGATAFFFIGYVEDIFFEKSLCDIKLNIPKILYKINRRDYFRYTTTPEHPIAVEFEHSNITYNLYLDNISGGGFSMRILSSKNMTFGVNDILQKLKIYFNKGKVTRLNAKIIYIENKSFGNAMYRIYGLKFYKLSSHNQDLIIKNIFSEQRAFSNILKDSI